MRQGERVTQQARAEPNHSTAHWYSAGALVLVALSVSRWVLLITIMMIKILTILATASILAVQVIIKSEILDNFYFYLNKKHSLKQYI